MGGMDDISLGVLLPVGQAQWGGADPRELTAKAPAHRGVSRGSRRLGLGQPGVNFTSVAYTTTLLR